MYVLDPHVDLANLPKVFASGSQFSQMVFSETYQE